MTGPLSGIRVVDLTSIVSGPVAMATLADQGADVIKVEAPRGDTIRHARDNGMAPLFLSGNRGKRSLVLDLKKQSAKDVLWRLIERADVFAQNFRPGAIERLGFSADAVLKRKPDLVYLSISGVGATGPYAKKRVYDPVIQALSGLTDIQVDAATGRPRMIRTVIADKVTAIYAAQAVTAALYHRLKTGTGQHVQVSMLDAIISFLWPEGMAAHTIVSETGKGTPPAMHDLIFPTKDGYITVGAVSDAEWHGLCAALNRPDWVDDPRFATLQARSQNRQERMECVEAELKNFTTAEALQVIEANDVPSMAVLTRAEMLEDAQVKANNLVMQVEQPGVGIIRQARPAALFSETPATSPRPAPRLGEHTEDILAGLGYSEEEMTDIVTNATDKNS